MIIETKSAKETYDLGKKIGSHAKAGEVYTLVGDLGVGKTVFTQGLAKGLGIEEPISSPTFTIVQVYDDGRLPFYHFDVYRIGDIEEMDEIGFEDYVYGDGVSLIEWANLIDEILPANRTEITIEKDLEQGFDFPAACFDASALLADCFAFSAASTAVFILEAAVSCFCVTSDCITSTDFFAVSTAVLSAATCVAESAKLAST